VGVLTPDIAGQGMTLPEGWGDADWWRSANAVHDVGEVYARWRRAANVQRAAAWARRQRVASFKERMGY